MILFDTFVNQTIITGQLVCIDPIRIGSSKSDNLNPVGIDDSVLKDGSGNPVIPGSSIKGVVRSYFESVMRSLYGEKGACDVMDENNHCTKKFNKEIHANGISAAESAKRAYDHSCITCRLFGGRELAGKLKFKDCYAIIPEGEDRIITEFRDGVGIDRDTGAAKKGAKYDFEIVPKGTRFDFCLIADNLDNEQEKYLDFIKKYLTSREMAVGGRTTAGFGRIMLDNPKENTVTIKDIEQELKVQALEQE